MILTPDFVFLNHPKTGSTFVRSMIKKAIQRKGGHIIRAYSNRRRWKIYHLLWLLRLNKPPIIELYCPRLWNEGTPIDQHGAASQIPLGFRSLPVGVAVRNPLDRYVSFYKFEWWKQHPIMDPHKVRQFLPSFPNLTFAEYIFYREFIVKYFLLRNAGINDEVQMGFQTIDLIRTVCFNPEYVIRNLNSLIRTGIIKDYIPKNMILLKTENLNNDLYNFMTNHGYKSYEVSFVKSHSKIRPGNNTNKRENDDTYQHYYTSELADYVLHKERLLIEFLRKLGIDYTFDYSRLS